MSPPEAAPLPSEATAAGPSLRGELGGLAVAGLAALAVIALVVLLGGARLLWSDEFTFATAAREVAAGRPPFVFTDIALFIARAGFPYEEPHARGGVQVMGLAMRAFGASEQAAIVPAMVETWLAALVVFGLGRGAGLDRGRAILAATLVTAAPTVAGFAGTAFLEPALILSSVLGLSVLVARTTVARTVLAGAALLVGVSHRETTLLLLPAMGLGLFLAGRGAGEPVAVALRRAAIPAVVAGLVALVTLRLCTRPNVIQGAGLGWMIAQPILPQDCYREAYYVAYGRPVPEITLDLLLTRAGRALPGVFWSWDGIAGKTVAILSVHVAALVAALGLARRSPPLVRALAAGALVPYLGKVVFLGFLYAQPDVNARLLAPEGAGVLVAALVVLHQRLGASRASWVLALLLAGALATSSHVALARGRGVVAQEQHARALAALVPEKTRGVATDDGGRLAWIRPGLHVFLPPATEPTLDWLAERAPVELLILDAWEPLVAAPLSSTGRVPRRLGRFELAATDRSLGVTLCIYARGR